MPFNFWLPATSLFQTYPPLSVTTFPFCVKSGTADVRHFAGVDCKTPGCAPSVWRSLAGLRPAFGAFGPGTAADKTLYRLHALIPQMITFPTHLGIYIISQLPEFA